MKCHILTRCVRAPNPFPLFAAVLCSTVLFTACGDLETQSKSVRSLPQNFVRGSFIVEQAAGFDEEQLAQTASKIGADYGCQAMPPEKILWESGSGVLPGELNRTYNLTFEGCDLADDGTQALASALGAAAGVRSASAEALAAASPINENDPDKSLQDFLSVIRRDTACDSAGLSSKPVIVAVVDTGIDPDHPDLKDMLLRDARGQLVAANFVGARARAPHDQRIEDGTGHGTHVAGLIAAEAANREGGVGVASCVNVKIMPIRVLDDSGSGSSLEIERGVRWAADNGADIINLSLGHTSFYTTKQTSFSSSLYKSLADQNVIVFAAAGNDGYVNGAQAQDGRYQYHFPSSYDNVVSVAATMNSGSLTSFSNRGDMVDVAAPGYRLYSTVPGSYGAKSGTSMASPVAAGIYAIALAAVKDDLQNGGRIDADLASELMQQSTSGSYRLATGDVIAGGVLDAATLVDAAKARFTRAPANDDEDGDEEPSQPAGPQATPFSFAGLRDGQLADWPQGMAIQNVPSGTEHVYFFWGESATPFSKAKLPSRIADGQILTHPSKYFFRGERVLSAVAVDSNGRALAKSKIGLRGY